MTNSFTKFLKSTISSVPLKFSFVDLHTPPPPPNNSNDALGGYTTPRLIYPCFLIITPYCTPIPKITVDEKTRLHTSKNCLISCDICQYWYFKSANIFELELMRPPLHLPAILHMLSQLITGSSSFFQIIRCVKETCQPLFT